MGDWQRASAPTSRSRASSSAQAAGPAPDGRFEQFEARSPPRADRARLGLRVERRITDDHSESKGDEAEDEGNLQMQDGANKHHRAAGGWYTRFRLH